MRHGSLRFRAVIAGLALATAMTGAVQAASTPGAVSDEVVDAFIGQTWNRTDLPVANGSAHRTWIWGETHSPMLSEAYEGAAAHYAADDQSEVTLHQGERIVQYFDKARMEYDWNRPADPPWNVTTGLLVKEMMTGRVQLGDDVFKQTVTTTEPFMTSTAMIPIAGDADSGDITPSYGNMVSPEPFPDGAVVDQRLFYRTDERYGNEWVPQFDPTLVEYGVTTVAVDNPTNHSVANVFWEFMNSTGLIWEDGQQTSGLLFLNPFYATGYPITEPFWGRTRVMGVEQDVLMQCFERRCLTYTPNNPDGWKVEFGNVGQHYYTWRYETVADQIPIDLGDSGN